MARYGPEARYDPRGFDLGWGSSRGSATSRACLRGGASALNCNRNSDIVIAHSRRRLG
jgi:hypothetical protein